MKAEKSWEERFNEVERATAGDCEETDDDGLGALRGLWSALQLMGAIIAVGAIVTWLWKYVGA